MGITSCFDVTTLSGVRFGTWRNWRFVAPYNDGCSAIFRRKAPTTIRRLSQVQVAPTAFARHAFRFVGGKGIRLRVEGLAVYMAIS